MTLSVRETFSVACLHVCHSATQHQGRGGECHSDARSSSGAALPERRNPSTYPLLAQGWPPALQEAWSDSFSGWECAQGTARVRDYQTVL